MKNTLIILTAIALLAGCGLAGLPQTRAWLARNFANIYELLRNTTLMYIVLSLVIVVGIYHLFNYISITDTHYTYVLTNYDEKDWNKDTIEDITFIVNTNTRILDGYCIWNRRMRKIIYKEPYDLGISIRSKNLEKIIINKIVFHKNKISIDIQENIKPEFNFSHSLDKYISTENEILQFKNQGIIDLSTIKEAANLFISSEESGDIKYYNLSVCLLYESVNVLYANDKCFDIEMDITFVMENGQIENKTIEAKFKRKKYHKLAPIISFL